MYRFFWCVEKGGMIEKDLEEVEERERERKRSEGWGGKGGGMNVLMEEYSGYC